MIDRDKNYVNAVYFKSSSDMEEILDASIDLIVTSPPYYNIKDYSKDGKQIIAHSKENDLDVGNCSSLTEYLDDIEKVFVECERVLKPNGKLCLNVPLMPIIKKDFSSHYNRDIIDLQSQLQNLILNKTSLYLMDLYIWNRTNPTKKIMFGSYPYPRNFYAQNTTEFITIYVKDGKPDKSYSVAQKEASKLSQAEWISYTKQIWDIPIPNRKDKAFGVHSALMPEEIAKRCIKLYSFVGDTVLDPFAGSGTTLKVAKALGRKYIGYELYSSYENIINLKLQDEVE